MLDFLKSDTLEIDSSHYSKIINSSLFNATTTPKIIVNLDKNLFINDLDEFINNYLANNHSWSIE